MSKKRAIEDIYPLSPMQKGMLFHTLFDPEAEEYFEQLSSTFYGDLDVAAFRRAWEHTIQRHPVLRTAVVWERRDEPYQVVYSRVSLPWDEQDWRHLSSAEQQEGLERYVLAQRARGFKLSEAPLMRIGLIRLADDAHRVIWSHHHMLLDAWCRPLVFKEIFTLYEAFRLGQTLNLKTPRPYRDYIAWLQQQDLSKAEGFWRSTLAGFTEPTPLVVDRARRNGSSPAQLYSTERIRVSAAASGAVERLARQHQLTVNTVVQGAWGLLLCRYSGSPDVVFGNVVSGRPAGLLGVESMVGLFINTLPVRVQVPPDATVVPWLQSLQSQQIQSRSFEYSPLVEIRKWSPIPAGRPLFESLLSFQSGAVDPLKEQKRSFGIGPIDVAERANYPLTVVAEQGPEMALQIDYDRRRFDPPAIVAMLTHFRSLLEEIAAGAHRRVEDLSPLAPAERHQLLIDWNGTQADYPQEVSIHRLIEEQVEHAPAAPAVVFRDEILTYRELDRRANQLAHYLRTLGVGRETLVGLCVERSLAMTVGILGVLKAGGAYVPLDPAYPKERLGYMLTDAGIEVLLTQENLLVRLPAHQERIVRIVRLDPQGADAEAIRGCPEVRPEPWATAENLAYVIYTSGSTGLPKGVLIGHRQLVNYSLEMVHRLALRPADRILQFASLSFDVVVEELFPAWLAGATVVVPEVDLLLSTADLEQVLRAQRITAVELPAAFWHQWVADLEAAQSVPPSSLRFLIVGSEKPDPERLAAWGRLGVPLVYIFGLTETSVTSTLHWACLDPATQPQDLDLPIGRPIGNTTVYALGPAGWPVPGGVPGEMFIGGAGVGRGYHRRPGLTAERFVPDPFGGQPGQRLYRTGDLIRYRPDGNVEFHGRIDDQVKVRGFRVELGEVEAALRRHPEVRDAAVAVRDGRLVGYLVHADPVHDDLFVHGRTEKPAAADLSWEGLRRFLQTSLPEHMIPSAFVRLDALPLTANGKLDRSALTRRELALDEVAQKEYAAPRNPMEELLAGIWREVLGVEQVGIHDNFFALGGDSILSIQVTSRAHRAGVHLTPRQIFEHPTVAELAQVAGSAAAVKAEQGAVTGPVSLTPIQQWFFALEPEDPHHFNLPVLLELQAAWEPGQVARALDALLVHHDALRLRFAREDAGWRQWSAEPGEGMPFVAADLAALPVTLRAAALERASAALQAAFDLAQGPLLRVALFDLGSDGRRLLLACHHLIVDTVSLRILVEDLAAFCDLLSRGEAPVLPAKTTSFKRWAELLTERARSADAAAEAAYWLDERRAEVFPLPVDHPAGVNTEVSGRTLAVSLDEDETRSLLQEVHQAYRTQVNDILLTALAQGFATWTGDPLLLVDLEGHGREEDLFAGVDLSRTIGWFANVYPVLLDLRKGATAGLALKAVKEQIRAVPGRGIGYGLLRFLREDGITESLRGQRRAQVLFNYLGQLDKGGGTETLPLRLAGEPVGPALSQRARRSHLLEVNAEILRGRLRVSWVYSQNLHQRPAIERLADGFLAALRALIEHCKSPAAGGFTPSDFPLAGLDQDRLDGLVAGEREIEDLYPLSPLQTGMLFHALYAPEAGVYMGQLSCSVLGQMKVEPFQRAWQRVVDRHTALRTSFRWEGLEAPLQVVHPRAKLLWEQQDWRGLSDAEQRKRLVEYLAEDRQRGFDLTRTPLMRVLLARTAEESHQLVWSFHQILLDGWSLPVVFGEGFALYEAAIAGRDLSLPPSPPYRGYIAWLKRQDQQRAESYWRGVLEGFSGPTPLAFDRAAGVGGEARTYRERFLQLSTTVTGSLRETVRRHQLTLNTLVQGAWALILGRHGGEEDVVFGSTVSGRPADLPGIEETVGLFINTLPVRVMLPAATAAAPWLRNLQERQAELRQYEYTALSDIQKWNRVATGQRLFDSLLVVENYPMDEALKKQAGTLRVVRSQTEEKSNFALTAVAMPGRELNFSVSYYRERFDDTTITRLLGHLSVLLEELLALPDRALGTLPLLTAGERHQLASEWSDTRSAHTQFSSIHSLFAAQVARNPGATAVLCAGEALTYGELDARANRLARHLRDLGAAAEVPVAVCLERSPDLVIAALAIFKAGAVYVPLDPAYPRERLVFVLEDTAAPLLLTESRLVEVLPTPLPHAGTRIVCLDTAREEIAVHSAADPAWEVDRGALAYLIFTSGSTGRPKAVQVEHGSLANTLLGNLDRFGFGPADSMAVMAAFSFDISLFECFCPLLAGGTSVLLTREEILDPTVLTGMLGRVTAVHAVPSLMRQIVSLVEAQGGFHPGYPSLRALFVGGEAVPAELLERLRRAFPSARIFVLYGPTESTIICTAYEVSPAGSIERNLIGRPLANTGIRLLDRAGYEAPIGVSGEICITGAGVARGYLGRPELSAERFVPLDGMRAYRTGDLARWRPDGTLEFLGRSDRQIKVRGFRVELGEIESVLEQNEIMAKAVVLLREDVVGQPRLVAYCEPKPGLFPQVVKQSRPLAYRRRVLTHPWPAQPFKPMKWTAISGSLRAFLQERLPEHMVPTVFLPVHRLPLLPSGKVDRGALPAPGEKGPETSHFLEPQTSVEQQLARIWCEVLGVSRVGLDDNFFALGGDSILSIQIVAKARQAGIEITPRQVFENPKLSALAAVAGKVSRIAVEQGPVTGRVALTPIQRRFFANPPPQVSHFNRSALFEVHRAVRGEALHRAVQALMEHHDALRLRFTQGPDGWQQHNASLGGAVPWVWLDLSALAEATVRPVIESATAQLQRSLDITAGPLLRVAYFHLGPGAPGRLWMAVHHLVVDDVSWPILLEDLERSYEQASKREPIRFPAKTTSFQHWAERLEEYARSEELQAELGYWTAEARRRVPRLPVDFVGANSERSHQTVRVVLEESETEALQREISAAYRAQVQDALLTALAQALGRWQGGIGPVLVDLEGHGREEELLAGMDLTRTVGWFSTLYPVLLDVETSGAADPGVSLKRVKEQLRSVPHRGIGYGLLRYLSGSPEAPGQLASVPSAEVIFNYMGQGGGPGGARPAEASVFMAAKESSGPSHDLLEEGHHLIDVNGRIAGGRLHLGFSYSANVHARETIERLAAGTLAALRELIAHCQSPEAGGATVSDFPLAHLSQEDVDRVVGTSREVEDLYPLAPLQQGMLFHTLYEPSEGAYVTQMSCELEGVLDLSAFRQAWQAVVARHTILRTGFLWEGLAESLQKVVRAAEMVVSWEDWQGLPEEERRERLTAFLLSDRRRGFNLSEPPLMRLWLAQTAETVHQCVWTMHHILLDGWCLGVVLEEVVAFYEGLRQGREVRRNHPRSFRDYIAWLTRQDLGKAEAFWRRSLTGFTAPTPLALDRPFSARLRAEGSIEQELPLSMAATERLQALARRHQLTLNTWVQGAWAVVLSRYGGEPEVIFGSVVAGRPAELPGVESILGLFINTLPVRADVSPHRHTVECLRELQQQQLEMRQYEYTPLASVQSWSGVAAGQPLFDSILVFENFPLRDMTGDQGERPSLRVRPQHSAEQANYPISVSATSRRGLMLGMNCYRHCLDATTVERMLRNLAGVLEAWADEKAERFGDLPLLVESERQQLLWEWSESVAPRTPAAWVHTQIAEQARRQPEALALSCGDERWSYGELEARSNVLARLLRSRGLGREVPVGVFLDRSIELATAALAVWKAGGVYVPLDPAAPAERLRFLLEESQVRALITRESLRGTLPDFPATGPALLLIEEVSGEAAPLDVDLSAASLAYLIFTSGTTGRPKAVMVGHGALAHTIGVSREEFGFGPGEAMLHLAPFSFDISLFELLVPLTSGGSASILRREEILDMRALAAALRGAARVHAVPSLMRQLVEQVRESGASYPDLRTIFTGGDTVPSALLRDLREVFPAAEVVVLYGPTETTIICTSERVTGASERSPLGRPLPGAVARLLDREGRLVPVGAPGELYLGGPGVARGYWNRPELTAERFVPSMEGGRRYRTGDLARHLADGRLEFLGRADQQVKVRGFRVELGEIEAALTGHPAVQEAVVTAPPREGETDRRLVAYVVAKPEMEAPDGTSLREYLTGRLPDYMVPAVFLPLASLPLTSTGKVDRRALPAPETVERLAAAAAPRTPAEEVLAGIWMEVLKAESVGIYDSFFELGGHSLLATQIASRIHKAFGISLPLRELFENPTVAGLAGRIEALRRLAAGGAGVPRIERIAREGNLPLSFAQQRLWFLDQLQPGSSAYNMPMPLKIAGPLDIPALARTLSELARRHESLRMFFIEVDGHPIEAVSPPLPRPLPVVDLSSLAESVGRAAVHRLAAADARRPFDLARGPVFRVSLVRLAAEEHVVLFTIHHIVSDGWSMGILVREVSALYRAFAAGLPSPLPELEIQYADFAAWQRNWLQGETLAAMLGYWRGALDGAPPRLDLPTDRPRPATPTFRGAVLQVAVAAELTAALKALGRREGVTLFMTLLAAFQTLLARSSGSFDISVGTPIAGRNFVEIEPLIGFFVNTLVLRTRLTGQPTFREALGRVREVTLDAYAHQDLPFEKLVEELQPERDLSHTPLFQVMFALQNAPQEELKASGLTFSPLGGESKDRTAKFEITLSFDETARGLFGSLEYNTDLFDGPTAARLAAHLEILLSGIAADPAGRLSSLPLFGPAEHHQVLVAWNDTRTRYPRDLCIHKLFEEQVEIAPESVALVCGEASWSYRDLNARANQLAHHLRALGVGAESLVAVAVERSAEMVVALLGILKAGGAYLPLDPSYPRARLELLLEEAPIVALLTQERLVASLPASTVPLLRLDADWPIVARRSPRNPVPGAAALNLAYVMYTSGSTGRPKGVAVVHRSVVRLVKETGYADLSSGEVVLQLAPLAFDASTFEIWGPLLNGGRLVVMPPSQPSLEDLGQALRRYGITTLWLTAGLFHLMVDERPEDLAALRQLLAGGDVLSPAHVAKALRASAGSLRLINGYGPTENTTFTCCHTMSSAAEAGSPVPLGRPIANTRVFIADRDQRPAPVGVAGELCLGGDGLARGYFGRPALTAASFVPDPFGDEPGERLYRTGDRARFLPGGSIEFLGRIDEQVKIRGFRIELGEVEAALLAHPQIQEAVVLAEASPALQKTDRPAEKRLMAYVTSSSPQAPATSAELATHLRERLPDYLVPASFLVLEALPLTPNGKVDRRALAEIGRRSEALAREEDDYVAPRTPVEQLVADIWSEVLGVERVGAHDEFFRLGGHSLLATQVMSRLARAFNRTIPLRALFEQPTVAGLARAIERLQKAERGIEPPPLVPIPRDRPVPLSFAQQRLWFIDQLEPGSPVYNMPLPLKVTGPLNVPALTRALVELERRHEVLRTLFQEVDGEPVQVILAPTSRPLPLIDLSGLPETGRRAVVERLAIASGSGPFDLARGPLLRISLLRLAAEEHAVLFVMHHIVSDGWSLGVIVREVSVLYRDYLENKLSSLPELPIQYADFAHWQREWLQGEIRTEMIRYWRQALEGAPPWLELPLDRPRPAGLTFHGAELQFTVPEDLVVTLRALCQREGVTPFMTLLAAFQILLAHTSGSVDISVGTPIAGRNQVEIEPLIGFFVNTLVLRMRLAEELSFKDLLGRTRETTLDAYAHQDLPFEKLVEELQPERDLSRSPLFQVMFTLQNALKAGPSASGLSFSPLFEEVKERTAKFEITLSMHETPKQVGGSIEYNTNLFDATTAARLIARFNVLLAGMVTEPLRPLSTLSLLAPSERYQTLIAWNDTDDSGGRADAPTIHGLFAAQAQLTPDRVALVAGDATLTYRELDARADCLARRLRTLGVGPEVPVGVHLPRSSDLIVALLAVLKAGGAYVPLDPTYSRQGLAFRLADVGAPVLVTIQELAGSLPEHSARLLLLDGAAEPMAESAEGGVSSGADSGTLAYVIYTSGSTGRPKGVAIEHRSAVALIQWARGVFPPADLAGVLAATSVNFDLSVFEIFVPLAWGGRVILADNALHLPTLAAASEVTLVNTVPAVLGELVNSYGLPASVRTVSLAGEALPAALVRALYERPGIERVLNLYGPSEDTTYSTAWRVPRDERMPAIGRPVAGTRAYLLDPLLRPVAIGVHGELCLGGAGLARGYLRRPDQTAERFTPDPFALQPGERLYRTGDLARHRPDGALEFLGRIDHQVKVRGFRIEPGEIEAALLNHPDVREAVVVARDDGGAAGRRLVAYVTPAGLEVDELRAHLRKSLADYMVPAQFVALEALPLTPTGKVDRRALPAPGSAAGLQTAVFVGPRSPIEAHLAQVWEELLHVPRVGIHDNFFDLGGHSLLATQVASRVRKAFEVDIPLRLLFENPTIAGLAGRIEALRRAATGGPAMPPLGRVAREGNLPLSFAQQRLWFLDQLQPGSAVYNLPMPLKVSGPLEISVLSRALSELARRHEALRTAFVEIDGSPVQVFAPPAPRYLPVVDLGGLPESVRRRVVERLAAADANRPFDLARGPLFRVSLLRMTAEEHAVLFTIHHIVSDGWSMGVIVREVSTLYRAFAENAPSPLPELEIQYADFAHWQRQWLQGETLADMLGFWRRSLEGAPPRLELPTDRPRPAVQSARGGVLPVEVPEELTAALKALGKREGTTPFMTLLAAFQALLARLSGSLDVSIGTPIAGRNQIEIEPLIGFFVNSLVLRTRLSGQPTFQDLLGRVREVTLDAYSHQDLPFEKLVEELHPERNLSHTPLFQVMFVLQNAPQEALQVSGLSFSQLGGEGGQEGAAKFEMTLSMVEGANRLRGFIEYRTDLFDATTIARTINQFTGLLAGVAADPARPVLAVPLLPEGERAQVLWEWNDTQAAVPGKLLPELLTAWKGSDPTAPALCMGAELLCYADLDGRANQLANTLRGLGVGPEVIVGVSVERSFEMVIAVLGVLKAGGAFLPLDPSYPQERLSFMLEDSGCSLLLTQKRLLSSLPTKGVRTLCLDKESKKIGRQSQLPPVPGAGPGNLASVMFTSGPAGRPHGVMVTHRGLGNLAAAHQRTFRLGSGERILQLSSLSTDAGVFELILALAAGATLVLGSEEPARPGPDLIRILREQKITAVTLPPSALAMLPERGLLPALRTLIATGEPCPPAVIDRWAPGRQLFNLYGPAEATLSATVARLDAASGMSPVGRPIHNVRLHILDTEGEIAPIGFPGELYIGGAGVSRGYLGRPDLTAERFLPDPFSSMAGDRLYATGDLARLRSDGEVVLLGRVGHQLKVRGFRIEPEEIEAALRLHHGVADAVVVARDERAGGNQRLVAYIVPQPGAAAPPAEELRSALRKTLPEYMLPAAYVKLAALPLTSDGEVDRQALPAPTGARGGPAAAFVAPRNALEAQVAQIWEELLDVRKVGIRDDFFEQGGHSLLAVRLMSRLEQLTGQRLPVSALFQEPTVEHLARLLRGDAALPDRSSLVPIQPNGGEPPVFWVHAAGGTVFSYQALSRCFGEDQPVYGIQAPGLDGEEAPFTSIEEMAAHYLEEIRKVAPSGAFRLGGWSMGGVVAFEMARQLAEKGETVGLLILLDAQFPTPAERLSVKDDRVLLQNFARELGLMLDQFPVDWDHLENLSPDGQLDYVLEQARTAGLALPDIGLTQARRLFEIFRINSRALASYRPQRLAGRVLLLRPSDPMFPPPISPDSSSWRRMTARLQNMALVAKAKWVTLFKPTRGWGRLSAEIEVCIVPGDHYTMLGPPHVQKMAEAIALRLRRDSPPANQ